MERSAPLLAARSLTKRFGRVLALSKADLDLRPGEIHALVGENGAGKTTLVKILTGVYQPDAGNMALLDQAYRPRHPLDAQHAGIALIPQELRIVPELTVAENVLLGIWPARRLLGVIAQLDRAEMRRIAREQLAKLGIQLDVNRPVRTLSFVERQSVVVARALSRDARILILDEPTASLDRREVMSLFDILRKLAAAGTAMIYVSHRLDEIQEIADKVTVLRDGSMVARFDRGQYQKADLIRAMTGRAADHAAARPRSEHGAIVLEAEIDGAEQDQRLRLRQGQVTGLSGLLGSGVSELLLALFWARSIAGVMIKGYSPSKMTPRAAIKAGVGYVPSERARAIVPALSVRDNIVLPNLHRVNGPLGLNEKAIDALVEPIMIALDIRPRDPHLPLSSLSGGNQQKVLFARWLVGKAHTLLLDEPTHGIDVGAKAVVKRLISEFAADGGAVLVHSVEIPDLLEMSDDIIAVAAGRIVDRVERGESAYNEIALREKLHA